MLHQLSLRRQNFPQSIIYCRRYKDCADLYYRVSLGPDFTESWCSYHPRFRLVDMYMSSEERVKEEIVRYLQRKPVLRVVIATVAAIRNGYRFTIGSTGYSGLGPPTDLESYVQETGRAGRDGQPSTSSTSPQIGGAHAERSMIDYTSNSTDCRRKVLFQNFE